MNLRDDIKYIKSGSLSNLYVNGEKADRISVTVMTVGQDGTISQEAVKTTGSFTYSDSTLNVGDKIAVYDGDVVPQLDGSVISDDDVSFFEITSAKEMNIPTGVWQQRRYSSFRMFFLLM